ncbi:HAD family phosphatase [Alteromonas pelagimontana]|uniref:HAD family phosphatase n=1 Tax=Alteromonas pelagimontana TaxID=1858656 RepID=A0A6M4MB38_9ALTE|nr:HAD family phosphatase [Alteromonas pelagimontana]QJR80373.1 HAD family phosphatase [Alteromonas pelagimontana]
MAKENAINVNTKAVLFDHDGTLIDSESTHFDLWSQVLKEYDLALSEDYYSDALAGIPVNQNAVDIVEHFNLNVPPARLAEAKHELTRQYLEKQAFPLMPNAKDAIMRCHNAGYKLAIVTGGSRISVERTLSTHGFDKMVTVTVAVEDVENSKPAPDCYIKAMQELGIAAENCVAVEDTAHGMQSAVEAGIKCVVIPTPHSKHHDFSMATAKYTSLKEWLAIEISD